jgi:GTP pyrophosphokinase
MSNDHMEILRQIDLVPYIQISYGLIDKPRKCGGNAFRHGMSTLDILIDYGYCNPVLLKASIIHDVLEDYDDFDESIIKNLEHGEDVLYLVKEVTRLKEETKANFLLRIKTFGSMGAKILKSADRISNVISLGQVNDVSFVKRYIDETEKYIYPIAEEANNNMLKELIDLIDIRKNILHILIKEQTISS